MKKQLLPFLTAFMCIISISMNAQGNYYIQTLDDRIYGDSILIKNDSICLVIDSELFCFGQDVIISYHNLFNEKSKIAEAQNLYNVYGIATQNAFVQKKGTFMIRNFYLIDYTFGYGITDFLNVQLGNTMYSANFIKSPFTPYLALKTGVSLLEKKIIIGGRLSYQRANGYKGRPNHAIFAYSGLLTIGSPDNNLNFNYTIEKHKYRDNVSLFSIGAKCKLNYRTSVLIELYAFNGHYNTMTFGFRSDMKRGSISYGVLSTTSNEFLELEGFPFPYIGFTLGFY